MGGRPPNDDGPRKFIRAEDDAGRGRLSGGLGEGVRRHGGVRGAVHDGARGRGVQDVVEVGRAAVQARVREEGVHVERSGPASLGGGVQV